MFIFQPHKKLSHVTSIHLKYRPTSSQNHACQLPVNLISECPMHHTCILSVSEGFWLLWNWTHHGSFFEVCLLPKTVLFLQACVRSPERTRRTKLHRSVHYLNMIFFQCVWEGHQSCMCIWDSGIGKMSVAQL